MSQYKIQAKEEAKLRFARKIYAKNKISSNKKKSCMTRAHPLSCSSISMCVCEVISFIRWMLFAWVELRAIYIDGARALPCPATCSFAHCSLSRVINCSYFHLNPFFMASHIGTKLNIFVLKIFASHSFFLWSQNFFNDDIKYSLKNMNEPTFCCVCVRSIFQPFLKFELCVRFAFRYYANNRKKKTKRPET